MIGLGIGVAWKVNKELSDGSVPINTVAPVISGTAAIGQTLTSTTGTWTSDTGITGYLYQWYRGATLITGATSSTYVLTLSDVGFSMTCRVAATDTDGTSAYVSSSNSIFLFDVDYQAILTFATNNSITLPLFPQQVKQNQLVLDLKAGGIWTQLDVLYIFANNSGPQFATINWKNPNSNRTTVQGALSFNTNEGFVGGTSPNYLRTNFMPASNDSSNYKTNTAGRYAFLYTVTGTGAIDGVNGVANNRMVVSTFSQNINNGTTSTLTTAFSTLRGMKSIQRFSSSDFRTYNGKMQIATSATPSVSLSAVGGTAVQDILRERANSGLSTISMYAMGANLATSSSQTIYDNFVDLITAYINNPQ
jgi:hypothetical protein